jgi:hypothetical protein
MKISEEKWERSKVFAGFSEDDVKILESMAPAMGKCVDEIVAALCDHWTSVPELKKFLDDPDLVLRLRAAQRKYFMELFSGDYGVAYANDRIRVGETHNRVGLNIQWCTGGFSN